MNEALRPQRATVSRVEMRDAAWLFEPCWPGERILARVVDAAATLTDVAGEVVTPRFTEVAELVAAAVRADEAVIDGVWTAQPFIGEGSPARAWAETLEREGVADAVPDPLQAERRRAFVAFDIVELDGEWLGEVPLQERRRLLESVLDEGVQVRLSPVVRHPVAPWLSGWRQNGFDRYLAKHANSRYRPGAVSDEWLVVTIAGPQPRGMVGTLIGGRDSRR